MLDRLSRPRTAAILAAAIVVVLAFVNGLDFPLSVPSLVRQTGHRYLDMCAFCSASQIHAELVGLGEHGRLLQGVLFSTIDILIPGLSLLAGLAVIGATTRHMRHRRLLLALPIIAAALDIIENAAIIALLVAFPAPAPSLAALQGIVSGLKFIAYLAVVVAMLVLTAISLARRLRK